MSTTVLIVGANRGLGLHFALQYLKKDFNVYGTYRKESADEAEELLESGAKTLTLNLIDKTSIQDASKSFGDQPLDILINCAVTGNGSPKWIDATVGKFMQRFRGNETGGNISYQTSKAALNMITVDFARELAPDKFSCISMSLGWVKTKMSNWTGPMEAPEAVTRMIKVIDGLKPSDTASFYHIDGHQNTW